MNYCPQKLAGDVWRSRLQEIKVLVQSLMILLGAQTGATALAVSLEADAVHAMAGPLNNELGLGGGYNLHVWSTYLTGFEGGGLIRYERRSYFTFDLSSVAEPIASAQLRIWSPPPLPINNFTGGYRSNRPEETFELHEVLTPAATIEAIPFGQTSTAGVEEVWADLGDGPVFGSVVMTEADEPLPDGKWIVVDLNAAAIGSLNGATGKWTVGGIVAPGPDSPADFDNDRDVDAEDLALWESAFGTSLIGDTDEDADTDGADFLRWQRDYSPPFEVGNWQLFGGAAPYYSDPKYRAPLPTLELVVDSSFSAAVTVPEPSSLMLAMLSLFAMPWLFRDRYRKEKGETSLQAATCKKTCGRLGFTLVELLVVIAVIGVLIALLLPAVQAAREAARRTQCTNNLKNVALGLLNFEDVYKRFPLGHRYHPSYGPPLDFLGGWSRDVLPFIEQNTLHETWDHTQVPLEGGNFDLAATPISVYQCPSSPASGSYEVDYYHSGTLQTVGRLDYAPTNDTRVLPEGYPNDAFQNTFGKAPGIMAITSAQGVGSESRKVTDGLSRTTLLTEKAGYPDVYFMRTIGNDDPLVAGEPKLTWVGQWARRNRMTLLPLAQNSTWGIPADCPMNCTNFYETQPYGFHTGGCNFAMGDGAVRFIAEDITLENLARLIVRDDGLSVQP